MYYLYESNIWMKSDTFYPQCCEWFEILEYTQELIKNINLGRTKQR